MMNSSDGNRGRLLALALLVALFVGAWVWVRQGERREMERLHPVLKDIRETVPSGNVWGTGTGGNPDKGTNSFRGLIRAAHLSDQQKADLAEKFASKFRPAVERWLSAYEGHTPFTLDNFTLDKFHSTLGSHMFTFMIGEITLTLVEPRNPDQPAKVGYLMSRQAALDMNRLPGADFVPQLNLPVTREQVILMVKADTGVEFKLNEVMLKPTAKACALNGGAFVDLLPAGADPNNFLNNKISMVFDADGKLVNYERAPSF